MKTRLALPFLLGAVLLAGSGRGSSEEIIEIRQIPDSDFEKPYVEPQYREHLKKKQAKRDELAEKRAKDRAHVEDEIKKLNDYRKNTLEKLDSTTVTVDERTIEVKEPNSSESALDRKTIRDQYEISPDDFEILVHDRWALNKNDFRFDEPQYIVDEIIAGHTQKWWGFSFSIVNSTTKKRRILPTFVAVTNKGVFTPSVTGFLPQRLIAESTFHPMEDSKEPRDKSWAAENVIPLESSVKMITHEIDKDGNVKPSAETGTSFEAGQTRWGVALWPAFNDEFTELKIVIGGLTNAHRYDRKQRRVLTLSFRRNDDEFHVNRSRLIYEGKHWEYLWMWDQDIGVPIPTDPKDPQIKDKTITTPAGAQKLMWSFPYTITNSFGTDQTITIKEVRFVLRGKKEKDGGKFTPFEVEVGGEKAQLDEIHIVDDGRSSIYKAQYLREINASTPPKDTDRFVPDPEKSKEPEGRLYRIKSGDKVEGRIVLDAADVDWDLVRHEVEGKLSLKADKKALADKAWQEHTAKLKDPKVAEKNPGIVYDPVRNLTDDTVSLNDGRVFAGLVTREDEQFVHLENPAQGHLEFDKKEVKSVEKGEFSKVKEQITAQIPAALEEAKKGKQVSAYFSCEAGLATGQYRISRSYRQLGVIQDEWLKAWEELDKPAP